MASQIDIRHSSEVGTADGSLGVRWENATNTPIVSVTDLGLGQKVADTYVLDFTKAGGVFTVVVTYGEGAKNPYYSVAAVTVTADDATGNTNIIPDLEIVLSSSIVTGWRGQVTIGAYQTSGGVITDVLNCGVVQEDSNTTPVKLAAVNIGGDDSVDTTIDAVPGFYWSQDTAANLIAEINSHTDDTREHLAVAGTYTITFQNWADGAGGYVGFKTCDVYVDGSKCITTAVFDGSTRFQYGDGIGYDDGTDLLAGLSLVLANDTDDPTTTTVTLVVSDGDDWVWLAEDNAGAPGTYQTAALTLTEAGQAAGTIRAGQLAYFWFKWAVPDGSAPGAIKLFRLSTRGLTV